MQMYDDVRICWMGCDSMTDRLTYVLEHQFSLADSVCDSRVQNTIRVFFSRRAIWPRPGKARLPRFSWIVPATTCLYCWSVFTDCYGCYGSQKMRQWIARSVLLPTAQNVPLAGECRSNALILVIIPLIFHCRNLQKCSVFALFLHHHITANLFCA